MAHSALFLDNFFKKIAFTYRRIFGRYRISNLCICIYLCMFIQEFSVYEIKIFHLNVSVVKVRVKDSGEEYFEGNSGKFIFRVKQMKSYKGNRVHKITIDTTVFAGIVLFGPASCKARVLNLPMHEFSYDSECFQWLPKLFSFILRNTRRYQESTLSYSPFEVINM